MIKSFAFLLLASSARAQFPGMMGMEMCDICVGNDQVDAAASLGPIPCPDWLMMNNFTFDGSESCTLGRAAGAKFCACGNTVAFNTCYLCGSAADNAAANIDMEKYIPDSPGGSLTCADMLEMPAVDDVDTCNLLTAKYARWCGCPNVDQNVPCPFCPEGAPPNLEKEYPFAMGSSCQQMHDFYQVMTADACEDNRISDFRFYVIDMLAYCECPGRSPPNLCEGSFCPSGQGVPTSKLEEPLGTGSFGITCGDSSFLMEYITKEEDCEFLFSQSGMCCGDASEVAEEVDSPSGSGDVPLQSGGDSASVASKTSLFASFWTFVLWQAVGKVVV